MTMTRMTSALRHSHYCSLLLLLHRPRWSFHHHYHYWACREDDEDGYYQEMEE